jgi:hypothetical protein
MTASLQALLERLKPVARDLIVERLGHTDTCIPTSRILQPVLEHFGFQSIPVATEVNVYNRVFAEMVKFFGDQQPTVDQIEPWRKKGAFSVRISPDMATAGVPISGTGWDGHLILRVEDTVLDGSIEMCNRPAKSIILPKLLWVSVDENWDLGKTEARETLPDGCEVSYKTITDNSWQNTAYWKEPFELRMRAIVEQILGRV